MYTEHVSKFCHVCATISFKVMVISTLFADLRTADNGRNEPNLSPGLFKSDLCDADTSKVNQKVHIFVHVGSKYIA